MDKSHSKLVDVFSSTVVGISCFDLPTSIPSTSCNRSHFSLGNCLSLFHMVLVGLQSEYSVTLATVISPGGEPLIEAELIKFLACGFIHGSWEREDLSLPEGSSLRHRNLDFPEGRLPLPYHQQGAPLGTEK